jgi:hypothetical protein
MNRSLRRVDMGNEPPPSSVLPLPLLQGIFPAHTSVPDGFPSQPAARSGP